MPPEKVLHPSTESSSAAAPAPASAGAVNEAVGKVARRGPGIWLLGIFVALFVGYKVVPLYYYYFDIKSNCAQVLRNAAVESDEELRRDLLEVVQRHGIDVAARDIGIQRVGSRIKIWLNYQEPLDVSFGGMTVTLYTFDFTPSAERVLEE